MFFFVVCFYVKHVYCVCLKRSVLLVIVYEGIRHGITVEIHMPFLHECVTDISWCKHPKKNSAVYYTAVSSYAMDATWYLTIFSYWLFLGYAYSTYIRLGKVYIILCRSAYTRRTRY